MKLLSTFERLAPLLRLYPRWARALFAVAFAFMLASVGVFTALSPSANARLTLRGVSIDVGVVSAKAHRDKVIPPADLKTGIAEFDAPLTYEAERVGKTLHVTPRMDYLSLIAHGGPLRPVGGYQWWDAAATYPALDVKLLNETKRTLFVTSVDVVVGKSAPYPLPVPVIRPGSDAAPRSFGIWNEGTPMRDVRVAFDIDARGAKPRWRAHYPYAVHIGRLDDWGEVPLARALHDEGVDVAAIAEMEAGAAKRGRSLGKPTAGERVALERAAGRFNADQPVLVYGTVTYRFPSAAGDEKTQSVRFSSSAYLALRRYGIGSAYKPTGYYNVRLRTSGAEYAKAVEGVSQVIRPGDPDRFQIALAAHGPSRHQLRLRISFNGAEPVLSAPFDVRMFVPRTIPTAERPQPVT